MVTYRFKLVNATQGVVRATYTTPRTDETVEIAAGEERFIYEREQTNSGVKPYFRDDEMIGWLLVLTVQDANGNVAGKDLREVRWWTFEARGEQGIYTLQLQPADFQTK